MNTLTHTLDEIQCRLLQWMASAWEAPRLMRVPGDASDDVRFTELALEVCRAQWQGNPIYQQWLDHLGVDPSRLERWQDLPAVPIQVFKAYDWTCVPEAERSRVFHSSGTSGEERSRHWHGSSSLHLYERSLAPWFEAHFFGDNRGGDDVCPSVLWFLTPPPDQAPHSSLIHMFETVSRDVAMPSRFFGSIDADGSWCLNLEGCLEALEGISKPVGLLGTAFQYVHLLDAMRVQGRRLRLPQGSRLLETGGYKGRSRVLEKKALHEDLAIFFGVPQGAILSEYGMSELSSQAYDRTINFSSLDSTPRRFRFPPWVRHRVVNPETGSEVGIGETGCLQVYDLANAWSAIAIQTEDLAVRHEDGFELAGRITEAEGRGCSLMSIDSRPMERMT